MAVPQRAYFSIILGVGLLLSLTACAADDTGVRTTVVEVQGTSYVVQPPITTTTTTTLPAGPTPEGEIDPLEQSYTVQPNDGPSRIASLFGITQEALFNFNAWPEGTAHVFLVGELVRIPPGSKVPGTGTSTESGTGSADPASSTTGAPAGVGCQHTVVAGDNPTRVAKQYDITIDELANANVGNAAYGHFQLGSLLNIPTNGSC